MVKISLRFDEVVFEGLASGDATRLQHALHARLTQALQTYNPAAGAEPPIEMGALAVDLDHPFDADRAAMQITEALFEAMEARR